MMFDRSLAFGVLLFVGLAWAPDGDAWQKAVVERPFHVEGRGAAATFEELWSRADVVVEGVITDERPSDYSLRGSLLVHTTYDIRISAVFKGSGFAPMGGVLPVRRRGGIRDLGDRVERHVADNFPLFTRGERYVMFLRKGEWSPPSPHSGVYFYGATNDGPDSFYRIDGATVSSHSQTNTTRTLAGEPAETLRRRLREAAKEGRR